MKRLIEWWDDRVYWWSWKSVNRMCHRNPGMAYLIRLHIDEFLDRENISDSLKHATEVFYESLRDAPKTHRRRWWQFWK